MKDIKTTDEFTYNVLNKLITHNTIIVNKTDINSPLQNIINRLTQPENNQIEITHNKNTLTIKKTPETNYNIRLRQQKKQQILT